MEKVTSDLVKAETSIDTGGVSNTTLEYSIKIEDYSEDQVIFAEHQPQMPFQGESGDCDTAEMGNSNIRACLNESINHKRYIIKVDNLSQTSDDRNWTQAPKKVVKHDNDNTAPTPCDVSNENLEVLETKSKDPSSNTTGVQVRSHGGTESVSKNMNEQDSQASSLAYGSDESVETSGKAEAQHKSGSREQRLGVSPCPLCQPVISAEDALLERYLYRPDTGHCLMKGKESIGVSHHTGDEGEEVSTAIDSTKSCDSDSKRTKGDEETNISNNVSDSVGDKDSMKGGFKYKCTCKSFTVTPDLGSQRRGPSVELELEKTFKCTLCDKAFCERGNLETHMITHTREKPYACTICDKVFLQSSLMKMHMKAHMGEKPFNCPVCDKGFSRKSSIKRHMRIHNGDRPYQCTLCDKAFCESSDLKRHTRFQHEEDRPFKCTICDKAFSYSGHLTVHVRLHKNERPYLCAVCGAAFVMSSHLKEHARTHNGEKPFKCTTCQKGFSRSSHLKVHIRSHTGERPYKCVVCDKGFYESSDLNKHMYVHDKDRIKPYQCVVCDKAFRCPSLLKKHTRVHNENE